MTLAALMYQIIVWQKCKISECNGKQCQGNQRQTHGLNFKNKLEEKRKTG